MGSKLGMAAGMPERRLRPIWDAVDSRQFKSALKLTNSLLSKHPSSPYALALKALVLERLGKLEEALTVCLSAKQHLFSGDDLYIDDLTLSTLQIVLQRLDRLDLATSCYEFSCGKYPNNLELMMGLFHCYVREYAYVKQQQTAIKMYKIVGEERFLFWAVCSVLLQDQHGGGEKKLISFAEALIRKHQSSNGLHEPEGVLVYISVLEKQGKFNDALEIISGNLGSLISTESDRLRTKGMLLASAGDYFAAAEAFQLVLNACPDDWQSFLHYLGSVLEDRCLLDFVKDTSARKLSHLQDFDARMEAALVFVQKLMASFSTENLRGPSLALLEIEKQRFLYGKVGDGKNISNGVIDCFSRFGHLSSFASDVDPYLQLLTEQEKMGLLDEIVIICKSSSSSAITRLSQVVSIYKIEAQCGTWRHMSINDMETKAAEMVELYSKSLPLSNTLDPQENIYGEELLTLACNMLVVLFYSTMNLSYLLEAVMILEFGLVIGRFNWESKILLLHLYSYLGALPIAYDCYKTLNIKNMLLETVSHNILPQMVKSPLWSHLSDVLNDYVKFMDDYFKEAADLTFLGYRHRNYTKVIEFAQFKEKLQGSYQYLMAKLESSVLLLKQKAESLDETEAYLKTIDNGLQVLMSPSLEKLKILNFHEDLETRPWWTPYVDKNYLEEPFHESALRSIEHKGRRRLEADEISKGREAKMRLVVENRSTIPRLVYLSIQNALSFRDDSEINGSTVNLENRSEFKHLLEQYTEILGFSFSDAERLIVGLTGSKDIKGLGPQVIEWMNFAVFVNAFNLFFYNVGFPNMNEEGTITWHVVDNLISMLVEEKLESAQPLLESPGSILPLLVQIVSEPLSWHCLILQSSIRSLTSFGKKKKKSGQAGQLQTPLIRAVQSSARKLRSVLQVIADWCRKQIDTVEDEKLDILSSSVQLRCSNGSSKCMSKILAETVAASSSLEVGDRISQALDNWCPEDVLRKVITGQNTMLAEFLNICTSKLKLLNALQKLI